MFRRIGHRINKWSEAVTLLTVEFVLMMLAFFLAIALLIILIRQVFGGNEPNMDKEVFEFLARHVSARNTSIMQFFTILGSHQFLIPAFLLFFAWYYFIRRHRWYLIKIIIIAVNNLVLLFALKYFFNRPRPLIPLLKEVPGLSFPSGHAFMSLTFFGLIMYIMYREVKSKWVKWLTITILCLIVLLIGVSRVYLRVHYASDVIAGYCFGALSLIILLMILRQIERYNAAKLAPRVNVTKEVFR